MRWLLPCLALLATPCFAQNTTVGASAGNKTVQAIYVGEAGGNHAVLNGYIGTSSGNKLFFSALKVTASPSSLSASSTARPVTASTTATAVGGTGAYTYAWTDGGVAAIATPSAASTTFSASVSCGNSLVSDIAVITVRDTGTGITATANVPLTFTYSGTPC